MSGTDVSIDETMTLEDVRHLCMEVMVTLRSLQPAVDAGLETDGWDDDILEAATSAGSYCPTLVKKLRLANRTLFKFQLVELDRRDEARQLVAKLSDLLGEV